MEISKLVEEMCLLLKRVDLNNQRLNELLESLF